MQQTAGLFHDLAAPSYERRRYDEARLVGTVMTLVNEVPKEVKDAALDSFAADKNKNTSTATEIESKETAIENDAYKLAQQLVIACEKAQTAESIEAELGNFSDHIKALPNKDDQLDVKAIGAS